MLPRQRKHRSYYDTPRALNSTCIKFITLWSTNHFYVSILAEVQHAIANVCKHPLSNQTKYNVKKYFYSNCQILWSGTDHSTSRWESVFPDIQYYFENVLILYIFFYLKKSLKNYFFKFYQNCVGSDYFITLDLLPP